MTPNQIVLAAFIVFGITVLPWMLHKERRAYGRSDDTWPRRDMLFIVKSNAIATVGCIASIGLWLANVRQLGSFASVAPAMGMCCGLFGAIFAMLGLLRYRRRIFGVLVLWGVATASWVIYYLLVLNPQSLGQAFGM